MREYERCFTPDAIHAMCEDYRAGASVDLDHDRESRRLRRRIECEMLVICGARGVVDSMFATRDLWQAQCSRRVYSRSVDAGHFLVEEAPDEVAEYSGPF